MKIEVDKEILPKDRFNRLAERMKKGDRKAAGEIYDYFSPLIYRFVLARIGNKHLAEDLMQDIFVKVVSKIDSFNQSMGNFSGWIWQITRNTLIDYYRAKKEMNFSDFENPENDFSTPDDIYKKVEVSRIVSMIKNFNEEDQELFSLYYLSDLSYKEISKITHRTEGSLRVAAHRLLKKIKSAVQNDD